MIWLVYVHHIMWRTVTCQQYTNPQVACKHPPPFASSDIVCGNLTTSTLLGLGYAWIVWVCVEDTIQNMARRALR